MIHREIVSRLASAPSVLVDFCAAPGGKTTAAIDALPDGSVVIANEFESRGSGREREPYQMGISACRDNKFSYRCFPGAFRAG